MDFRQEGIIVAFALAILALGLAAVIESTPALKCAPYPSPEECTK